MQTNLEIREILIGGFFYRHAHWKYFSRGQINIVLRQRHNSLRRYKCIFHGKEVSPVMTVFPYFLVNSARHPGDGATARRRGGPRWRTAGRAPRCENNSSPDGRYAVVNPLTHRSKPNKGRREVLRRATRSGAAKFYPRASPSFFIIQLERGKLRPRKQRTIVKLAAKVLQIKRSRCIPALCSARQIKNFVARCCV